MIINEAILVKAEQLSKVTKVTFHLKEISPDDIIRLEQMKKAPGYLLFSHDKVKEEVEKIMKDRRIGMQKKGQSKSVILRGVIYQYFSEYYTGSVPGFSEYYEKIMDIFINMIETKINEKIHDNRDSLKR